MKQKENEKHEGNVWSAAKITKIEHNRKEEEGVLPCRKVQYFTLPHRVHWPPTEFDMRISVTKHT